MSSLLSTSKTFFFHIYPLNLPPFQSFHFSPLFLTILSFHSLFVEFSSFRHKSTLATSNRMASASTPSRCRRGAPIAHNARNECITTTILIRRIAKCVSRCHCQWWIRANPESFFSSSRSHTHHLCHLHINLLLRIYSDVFEWNPLFFSCSVKHKFR